MIMSILSILFPAVLLSVVRAAPWQAVHARQSNSNNSSTGFSPAIWISVVALGVFFLLAGLLVFRKKVPRMSIGRTAANRNAATTTTTTTTGETRELTAAELAGGARSTTTAGRRQRRPRRTPSQVSTRSLPTYMKEPGDHEVVIYRGLEDMDEEPEGESRNTNDSTTTTPDMTMNTEDSPESTRHSVNPSRGSYDHPGSDESHSRLMDVRRGEAPAYETINLDITAQPAPPHRQENSQLTRMPGFLSRFMPHRANNSTTDESTTLPLPPNTQTSPFSPSHSREPSAQSAVSGIVSADSHGSPRGSNAGRTHRDRNNNSSTGSIFTVLSRTLSRNHEGDQLTSPSMISLNSISHPLTHTTTRTEFSYPRTGPTSDQVKFLSSKETFGRFGVPYGPDAIAFAASSSRMDLPPDFDSIDRQSIGDLSPDGSTSSARMPENAIGLGGVDHSDRGGSPFPESTEPSPDLASLTDPPSQLALPRRESTPNLGTDTLTSPSQSSLAKQQSTPNFGVGHPSLSKSILKPKSMANFRGDGEGNLSPRSVSAAGSYLTVESFQTAHDGEDGSTSPSLTGTLQPVPQIRIQLPSNNPSLANVAEGESGSEMEEFFDGDEGMEESESEDEGGSADGGGNKTPKAASISEGHQSHTGGARGVRVVDPSDLTDEEYEPPVSDPKGPQDARASIPMPSSSPGSDLGSDESEAETRSNHTAVGKSLVTMHPETN